MAVMENRPTCFRESGNTGRGDLNPVERISKCAALINHKDTRARFNTRYGESGYGKPPYELSLLALFIN